MIKPFQLILIPLNLIIGLFYIGSIVQLLSKWVGVLGYVLWILVAPILSPAVVFLPWFDAWVTGTGVNPSIFGLWLVWISTQPVALLYSYHIATRK